MQISVLVVLLFSKQHFYRKSSISVKAVEELFLEIFESVSIKLSTTNTIDYAIFRKCDKRKRYWWKQKQHRKCNWIGNNQKSSNSQNCFMSKSSRTQFVTYLKVRYNRGYSKLQYLCYILGFVFLQDFKDILTCIHFLGNIKQEIVFQIDHEILVGFWLKLLNWMLRVLHCIFFPQSNFFRYTCLKI